MRLCLRGPTIQTELRRHETGTAPFGLAVQHSSQTSACLDTKWPSLWPLRRLTWIDVVCQPCSSKSWCSPATAAQKAVHSSAAAKLARGGEEG